MKRVFAVALMMVLMLSLTGCAKEEATSTEMIDTDEIVSEEPETEDSLDLEDDSSESDSGVLDPDFKQTMDDYEAWFDHYCDVMKRYKEDSSDLELLTEMTELMSEEITMLDELENMDQSNMNAAETAYYLEVTARIEKKLLEVAY